MSPSIRPTSASTDRAVASVAFRFGELEQLARLAQTGTQPIERADDGLEPGPLPTEFLRAIGVAPDRGILELAQHLREPLVAPVVVKGTS